MAYQKKTLRQLPPRTRKLAKLLNELDSIRTRFKNIMPGIEAMELDAHALAHIQVTGNTDGLECPTCGSLLRHEVHPNGRWEYWTCPEGCGTGAQKDNGPDSLRKV